MGNRCRFVLGLCLIVTSMAATAADEVNATVENHQRVDRDRYIEAAAAVRRGDYVEAYYFWRTMAEQGDAEAQYALGWMYHNGYGLVADDKIAKAWWEKAAAQGHKDAMFSLGTLYSLGSESIARDYPAAIRLWLQAAVAGHQNARIALRELMQRNLPELGTLTRAMRTQYPQILEFKVAIKNTRRVRGNSVMIERPYQQPTMGGFTHSGELLAVAAGYRPEIGWAAVQLYNEGEVFIAEIQQ